FLGVVGAVAMRHPGCAHDLRLSEKLMDKVRSKPMLQNEQKKHYESAKNESGDRGSDHRHNYFRPDTSVPFDHRPVPVRGRESRAAKSADERVTGARRQAKPPRGHVPDERGQHGGQHGPHGDDFGIDQTFSDRRSDRAAEQRAGQIEKRGHGDGLTRRQNFGRDDCRDGVGRVVKTLLYSKMTAARTTMRKSNMSILPRVRGATVRYSSRQPVG